MHADREGLACLNPLLLPSIELSSCLHGCQPLHIHFERSGQPIIFAQQAASHAVEFVFATLDHGVEDEDEDEDEEESQTNQVQAGNDATSAWFVLPPPPPPPPPLPIFSIHPPTPCLTPVMTSRPPVLP